MPPSNESAPQFSSTTWQSGEIYDASGLDGCQFLIKTASGQQLQPINLERNFQKNGMKIEFQAELVTDMMSICMAGPMVRILKIQEKK
ncbi:MAG: hypothetical protein ACOH5I_17930 [Oligoflexus sp.]